MKVGPRTNMGHQWGETSDNDRVECVWCLCSPLSNEQVNHIPKEGLDD